MIIFHIARQSARLAPLRVRRLDACLRVRDQRASADACCSEPTTSCTRAARATRGCTTRARTSGRNSLADGHTAEHPRSILDGGVRSHKCAAGNNAHVYSDVNDNNQDDAGEDVAPTTFDVDGHPEFINSFSSNTSDFFENCAANFPCSWDRDAVMATPRGMRTGRRTRPRCSGSSTTTTTTSAVADRLHAGVGQFPGHNIPAMAAGQRPRARRDDDGANTDQ